MSLDITSYLSNHHITSLHHHIITSSILFAFNHYGVYDQSSSFCSSSCPPCCTHLSGEVREGIHDLQYFLYLNPQSLSRIPYRVVRTCFADSNADFNSPWAMGIVIAALPADSKSDQISKCGIGSGYVMIITI